MTQTSAAQNTFEQLLASESVMGALATLKAQVAAQAATITDIRPPREELKVHYEDLLARAGQARGRGLYYPYISSGIGNGALIELADGSVKWDMISGIGVHFFGHSNPELIEQTLIGSMADTVMHGNLQSGFEPYEFSELLLAQASKCSHLKHCFVAASGALVNENAIKLCYQKHNGAPRVIAFKDCFMGRTVTMSQLGDAAGNRVGIPLSTLVDYMPFYDEAAARRVGQEAHIQMICDHLRSYIERYPNQHACFIFELVQGEGGFNTAPREFFVELMKICKEHNIAVWADEVQTFGRTEKMFAFDMLDLGEFVDVVTVGKMTQACATLFTESYNPAPGLLSATFTGSGSACKAGSYILSQLANGNYYGPDGLIAQHHNAFRTHCRAMIDKHPDWFPPVEDGLLSAAPLSHIGGVGGMMRFSPFGGKKGPVFGALKHCFEEGIILFGCGHGPYHIRMLPPLGVMKLEDWPRVFEVLERGLAKAVQEYSE